MKSFILYFLFLLLFGCAFIQSNPRYVSKTPKFYIVKKGDNLYSISKRFNISIKKIKQYNNLNSDLIIIGQKLYFTPKKNRFVYYVTKRKIPQSGYHLVKQGETLPIISVIYDVPLQELMDYNNLSSINVHKGQKIFLKPQENDSKKYSKNFQDTALKKQTENSLIGDTGNKFKKNKLSSIYKPKKNDRAKKTKLTNYKNNDYILPLKGTITSEFGIRHGRMHKGIDIAAPMGTPIKSIADGKVVFAGIQNGYGNVIIISHKNNIMTVYAHNERNLVRLNDTVKKGQPIATVGKTGRATGPHLHFEFRVKGRAINPKKIFNF